MAQVTGVVILRMDGLALRSKEKATLEMGGSEQTEVFADGELIGYSSKPVAAKVTATLAHTAESDVAAINNARNVSIEFACDSGVSFLIANAFSCKPPKLSGGEGDLEVEFAGKAAIQQ